jgi:hypothetical protein
MEKRYVQASEIKAVLDAGHKVWSGMAGRVGWIDSVDDVFCRVRLGRRIQGCTHGVTRFDQGDEAEMVWDKDQGHYIIQHPAHVWDELWKGREHNES